MSLQELKNRLNAEGVKFDVLCALPEGTVLQVGRELDGVLMWYPEDAVLPEAVIVYISPDEKADPHTYAVLKRIIPDQRHWHCLFNPINKKVFAAQIALAKALDEAEFGEEPEAHGMQG